MNKFPVSSIRQAPLAEPQTAEHKKLRAATVEFEAMLIREVLKSGTAKLSKTVLGGGMAEDFMGDMLNLERARFMAQSGGGLGLAANLEREILRGPGGKEILLKKGAAPAETVGKTLSQEKARIAYGGK